MLKIFLPVYSFLIDAAGAGAQPRDLQLFLLIGQSNMAGRGVVEAQDKEPIPRVFMLDKELAWAPAVDPLHFDRPQIAGVGIGRSFAKVLAAANPEASIGLIPAAVGGASLDQWKPGGKLYNDAVRRTRAAMKSGKLRGILWHQGEDECGTEEKAKSYCERWGKFVQALREELGAPEVPVLVGELGEFLYDRPKNVSPYARVVNDQLKLIPSSVPKTGFVSSAGLTHKGDILHFDAASLREFGRRYGAAFLTLDATWKQ